MADVPLRRFNVGGLSFLTRRTLERVLELMRGLQEQNARHLEALDELTAKLRDAELRAQEREQAAIARERDQTTLDYQVLMTHQAMLAGLRDLDPAFEPHYEACRAYTMTSAERLYALYKAVAYVVRGAVPGDLLETGVWRGGSMMLAARTLIEMGDARRRLLLFDTYEGHPKPDATLDVDLWGNRAIDEWQRRRTDETGETIDWARAPLDDVRANLRGTGYPEALMVFVKGLVERTAVPNAPERLALLRLDTDWYESTRTALEVFYPRLSPGGVLVVDDYGHYRGQREAVDGYFRDRPDAPLLVRVDYSCRLAVKPG